MKTNLLVIYDLDKAKHSEFREEIYFEIIDERVKAGRPIAISTNRLDAIEDYVGGAVCSRLKIGQIPVEMRGVDYRENMEIA
jgi:DNA replication protein DnaC